MRALLLISLGFTASAFAQQPIVPANTAPSAHPWYVKPEHGQWMICVKSYSGENSRKFAEALAQEIRERYQVPAYLFERGGAERQKERERHSAEIARKRAAEAKDEAAWNAIQNQARAEAAARGMDFLETKRSVKAAKVEIEDQYAVLVGGWPDMASARRELDKVRTWEPPANKALMDTQFIVRAQEGQRNGELAHINPFQAGMVVPNPVAHRVQDAENEAEARQLQKLNADEALSVLKIQKPWTIAVKLFTPPVELKGKIENRSIMAKLFDPKPDLMLAAAGQCRSMAEALRKMKPTEQFPYGPFESYILHTKYGSMLCVGQFESSDDPKLLEVQNQLGMLKFQVDPSGKRPNINTPSARLFDHLYAMRVKE